jgi:hypothetical protein
MPGIGKRIGGNKPESGKWRCKICKFSNESDLDKCGMCRELKQVLKE